MSRSFDWLPLAFGDPLPGDPNAISDAAAELARVADLLGGLDADLQVVALEGEAKSLDELDNRIGEARSILQKAGVRYRTTASALADYAPILQSGQSATESLLEDARAAQARANLMEERLQNIQRERASLSDSQATVVIGGIEQPDPYVIERIAQLDGAQAHTSRQFDLAMQQITEAQQQLSQVVANHDAGAAAAARAITNASDDGLADSWWTRWGRPTLSAVARVAREIGKWAGAIAIVLLVIVVIVAFIKISPALIGLSVKLLQAKKAAKIVVTVSNGAALADDTVKAIEGDKHWLELGASAVLFAASFALPKGRAPVTKPKTPRLPGVKPTLGEIRIEAFDKLHESSVGAAFKSALSPAFKELGEVAGDRWDNRDTRSATVRDVVPWLTERMDGGIFGGLAWVEINGQPAPFGGNDLRFLRALTMPSPLVEMNSNITRIEASGSEIIYQPLVIEEHEQMPLWLPRCIYRADFPGNTPTMAAEGYMDGYHPDY